MEKIGFAGLAIPLEKGAKQEQSKAGAEQAAELGMEQEMTVAARICSCGLCWERSTANPPPCNSSTSSSINHRLRAGRRVLE